MGSESVHITFHSLTPNKTNNTKMVNISEILFDDHGNFLGRDFKSWAKILGFYAVYYTFLGCLFYGFTVTYYLDSRVLTSSPVGGKPAVANARLDMPGAVVHPFKEMQAARGDINRISMDKNIQQDYCSELGVFFQVKEELNKNAKDCSTEDYDTESATCKVNLQIKDSSKKLGVSECLALLEKNMPMFTIDINKIIGWSPSNVGIHFQCYEYNEKDGKKLEEQKYAVSWLGQSSIADYYFPYKGVSSEQLIKLPSGQQNIENGGEATEACETPECLGNKPYNKPFVAGFIHQIAEKTSGLDDQEHMFRCDILSDKITRQQYTGTEKAATTNAELRGLNLGFVEFGFKF